MAEAHDAVVVGAGHNGLVAAILLARAGWNVAVLERNETPGGAARTAEVTLPGFKHDLYATGPDSFVGSAFYREFKDDLGAHGLSLLRTEHAVASVFPDGSSLSVSTDARKTQAEISRLSPRDGDAWPELEAWFWRLAPHVLHTLSEPMPSLGTVRALVRARKALGRSGPEQLAQLALQSCGDVTERWFERREVHALFGAWGMHLDLPPSMPGGAFFPLLKVFGGVRNGTNICEGGISRMIDALVSLLRSAGGELVTNADVDRVLVSGSRAMGVTTADGRRFDASRAVIAGVTPAALVQRLLRDVPSIDDGRAAGYRFGPGTLMLHLALDRDVPWAAGEELARYAYVHVGRYADDMNLAYHEARAGLIPRHPTLVIGQPTAVDPSRAPEGHHVLWVEVRMVPSMIRGDVAREITATAWDDAREDVADRALAILEEHAPGVQGAVIGRHVISPLDLERANPNLVGGDNGSGSHQPMQNFLLRPLPGWSRYRTPIDNLYICGAATWPGAGLGAASGYLLGKALTRRGRAGRRRAGAKLLRRVEVELAGIGHDDAVDRLGSLD